HSTIKPNTTNSSHPTILSNMKLFISTILLVALTTQGTYSAPSDDSTRGFFGGNNFGGVNPVGGGFNPVIGSVSPPVVGGGIIPPSGSVCQFFCNRGGKYVCCENSQQAHPGQCPIPRQQCPPTRSGFRGPQPCNLDIDCSYQNKCCYDTCLRERVCKPALYH
ncbi:unnamed protein product, partial [Meganyctiphanes norvegica]